MPKQKRSISGLLKSERAKKFISFDLLEEGQSLAQSQRDSEAQDIDTTEAKLSNQEKPLKEKTGKGASKARGSDLSTSKGVFEQVSFSATSKSDLWQWDESDSEIFGEQSEVKTIASVLAKEEASSPKNAKQEESPFDYLAVKNEGNRFAPLDSRSTEHSDRVNVFETTSLGHNDDETSVFPFNFHQNEYDSDHGSDKTVVQSGVLESATDIKQETLDSPQQSVMGIALFQHASERVLNLKDGVSQVDTPHLSKHQDSINESAQDVKKFELNNGSILFDAGDQLSKPHQAKNSDVETHQNFGQSIIESKLEPKSQDRHVLSHRPKRSPPVTVGKPLLLPEPPEDFDFAKDERFLTKYWISPGPGGLPRSQERFFNFYRYLYSEAVKTQCARIYCTETMAVDMLGPKARGTFSSYRKLGVRYGLFNIHIVSNFGNGGYKPGTYFYLLDPWKSQ